MPREVSAERLSRDTRRILNNPFWLEGIVSNVPYRRLHDDHDGTHEGELAVMFDRMGDAYVLFGNRLEKTLRFRTSFGGGLSPRVRNALMVLALAIKMDNEEKPLM